MVTLEQKIFEIENAVKMAGLATKEVLTFDEASVFTGLSKSFLYKSTSQCRIPHYKPNGKMIYFNRNELEKWLQQNRVSTKDEIQEEAQNRCFKVKR